MKKTIIILIIFSILFPASCKSKKVIENFNESKDDKFKTDWLFIYYMPYDNNLSIYGEQNMVNK